MTEDAHGGGAARLGRAELGERLGGFVYGTIVVLSLIVAGAKSFPHHAPSIAALVAFTTVVFWLAHVYAHAVAHSVGRGEHLSRAELRSIAYRESSIIEAAVPSLVALALGALGVISTKTSVWAGMGFGIAVLVAEGIVFARVERLGALATVGVVAANASLGLALIALKVVLGH